MTKDDIFNLTKKELENERFEKILESKNYLQNCYKEKEILNLANTLGELKIEYAKTNSDEVLNKIKQTKLNLIECFKKYNYDISKVLPKYNCKVCNDKGFLDNGKLCSCLYNKYLNRLLNYSKTNLETSPLLDVFDASCYEKDKETAKMIFDLQNIKSNNKNTILFSGETGTGKTFIAKSFLKTYILQNNLGLFYDSSNINQIFLNAHLNFAERDNILNEILTCDVLVIDDFGSEAKYNNVTKEYFLNLLNSRQEKNKITLFTTNLTLNDIKNTYNERFFSRLVDKNCSLKYNFTGNDLRLH